MNEIEFLKEKIRVYKMLASNAQHSIINTSIIRADLMDLSFLSSAIFQLSKITDNLSEDEFFIERDSLDFMNQLDRKIGKGGAKMKDIEDELDSFNEKIEKRRDALK
jgi:hypothetical protein